MKRERHPKHLDFIRTLPCAICLDNTATEACHLRASNPDYLKVNPGIGQKPSDQWSTPLCGSHHREQHSMGELQFWSLHQINPFTLCMTLWGATGNHELGERLIRETAEGILNHV